MILYDTLSREKKQFTSLAEEKTGEKRVNLYTCGPTVYDFAHIGNLRSYIFADTLRRALSEEDYAVKWVMNITDVDDKTIKKTIEKYGPKAGVSDLKKYTNDYFEAFKKNLREVNIPIQEDAITFIPVSDVIPEIQAFVLKLIEAGFAYQADDGSTYFSIETYQKKFGNDSALRYGALVGEKFLEGKKVGARVKVDDYEKENLSDFALWKAHTPDDGQIYWDHKTLGKGRPGWHIECSAINQIAFQGEPTDIHTGGVDLIFPHHTNEIAQSTPIYYPLPFVRRWAHCEHLQVNGKKMAKREKNFFTLEDLKQEPELAAMSDVGMALRYLTLSTHYRNPLNFTFTSLQAVNHSLENLKTDLEKINTKTAVKKPEADYDSAFYEDLYNDLNTAGCLSVIHQTTGHINQKSKIADYMKILGLSLNNIATLEKAAVAVDTIPQSVQDLLARREEARRSQQFVQSDALRDELDALGYRIDDTPEGPVVRQK